MGVSSLLLFYADRDVSNRLSEVPIYVFYTLNQQYGIWLDHVIFTDEARFSFIGENRLMDFPLKYYGIGMDASSDDAVLVEARQVDLRERMLVRLGSSDLYVGPEVGLNSFSRVRFRALEGGPEPGPLPRGGRARPTSPWARGSSGTPATTPSTSAMASSVRLPSSTAPTGS